MSNITQTLAGCGMLVFALWAYKHYKKNMHHTRLEDMWRSSQVLSVLALIMIVFIYLLIQVTS